MGLVESEYIERGVQIQEVDARELETQLVRTAALMDRHQPFVVLLTHYDELVQTEHRLNYLLLGKLLGVRIGLVEDKAAILAEEDSFRHVQTICVLTANGSPRGFCREPFPVRNAGSCPLPRKPHSASTALSTKHASPKTTNCTMMP